MLLEQIRAYVDHAFADIPASRRVTELKDELAANLMDKATDMIREGKSEQEAFTAAVAGIGDLSELAESVRMQPTPEQPTQQGRQKRATLVSIGVALAVVSPFVCMLLSFQWDLMLVGVFIMFVLIAAAVGLIVYAVMSQPKYVRKNETVIEQFKEFNGRTLRYKMAYRSFRAGFWMLTVALYFFISFTYQLWAVSWILFIIAVAVDRIIHGFFQLSKYNN